MLRTLCLLAFASVPIAAQNPTFTTIASNGYAAGDINSCAIGLDNLTTVGSYQFAGYYNSSRQLMLARRTIGSANWTTYNSGITISTAEIANDHNIIALSIDDLGKLHLAWNMHNRPLNYSISNSSVLAPTLSAIPLTKQNSTNAPSLFPNAGSTTNLVTYPIFLHPPGSSNMLFLYRNGGTGGGSGNGNEYLNNYNPNTNAWTNSLVINGIANSVNAYLNSPVYDSQGTLHITWTWRSTPNWQTNSNIMYAKSPDNGVTWLRQNGTPYTLPIIHSGSPASSVGEIVKMIPQNSSFINQTSMTVDLNDRPIIATYYAPSSNNPNRQYMLDYYDGTQWRTAQITNRVSDTVIDTSGAHVRDLARPIVLVDNANRTLVVTRSQDTAMGAYSNPATPNNNIVVYWTDQLNGSNTIWRTVALDSTNMGAWEPTYDKALWKSQNILSMIHQPSGLTGMTVSTVKVIDWNAAAYFAAIPEPFVALPSLALLSLLRRPAAAKNQK